MKKSAGVYVKLNGNAKVEGPSTKGVGPTKSAKQNGAQKNATPYKGGGNKAVPKPKK
jgi:hypothetical protein